MESFRDRQPRLPLRFPLRAPRFPSPEPIIQIEIAKGVNDLAASPREIEEAWESLREIPRRISPQMIEVFIVLKSLGAKNIMLAFGPSPEGLDQVLTPEEKAARSAAVLRMVRAGDGSQVEDT